MDIFETPILETYRKQLGNENLSEEELIRKFEQEKKEHNRQVDKLVSEYQKLDMDTFISRIGGQGRIDEMKRINEVADRMEVVNGKVVQKQPQTTKSENIEEWKRGFMEGFEEAYKRLHK